MKQRLRPLLLALLVATTLILIVLILLPGSRKKQIGQIEPESCQFGNEHVIFRFHGMERLSEPVFVYKSKSPRAHGNVAWQSPRLYTIEGSTDAAGGLLEITFPYPSRLEGISPDEVNHRLSVVCVLNMQSPEHEESFQIVTPLQTFREGNRLSGVFDFAGAAPGMHFELGFFVQYLHQAPDTILSLPPKGHKSFFCLYTPAPDDRKTFKTLGHVMGCLEAQKKKLELLRYDLRHIQAPVALQLRTIRKGQPVYVAVNKAFPMYNTLIINESVLDIPPDEMSLKQERTLSVCAGRELAHLVAASQCSADWLNIALANWFEAVALGDAHYAPRPDAKALETLFAPVLFGSDNLHLTPDGHAAALLFGYCMLRSDAFFGGRLFSEIRANRMQPAPECFTHALVHEDFGALYPRFAEALCFQPQIIFPGLPADYVRGLVPPEYLEIRAQSGRLRITDEIISGNSPESEAVDDGIAIRYALEAWQIEVLHIHASDMGNDLKISIHGDDNCRAIVSTSAPEGISRPGMILDMTEKKVLRTNTTDLTLIVVNAGDSKGKAVIFVERDNAPQLSHKQ